MGRLIAAADVGSNTAHLLIAHRTSTGIKRLVNESDWLSLGESVSRNGFIDDDKRRDLMATMERFRNLLDEYKVDAAMVFATEAMRRARNHEEILAEIKKRFGIQVDLISPLREAELSYTSIQLDCPGEGSMLMVEAGGGSVQVARCEGGVIERLTSLPLGSGAIQGRFEFGQPPSEEAFMAAQGFIEEQCEAIKNFPAVQRIVACGGLCRGLWRALHPDGERTLRVEELDFLAWDCSRLSTETIVDRYDVKINRARTLLPGSMVVRHIMGLFGHSEIQVSQYGVREGAIMELSQNVNEPWMLGKKK
jgi:exopolyphosphatase/guanosine-5'-triphosphate,3'-diphosphate pyrophosphatase